MSTTILGLRVVRGPDWKWRDQDGGEGYVGTVVDVGSERPARTASVQWDGGGVNRYRIGAEGAYDLRVLDSAPCGIRHEGVACDACNAADFAGIRWNCCVCNNCDICTACYMSDQHDTRHEFFRIAISQEERVRLLPRAQSVKSVAKGIFPGASVVRGRDWRWEDQDERSPSRVGSVVSVAKFSSKGARDAVRVQWSKDTLAQVYRVGFGGKVDVQCTVPGDGGSYYPAHLPAVDGDVTFAQGKRPVQESQCTEMQKGRGERNARMSAGSRFNVGEKVKVTPDGSRAKRLQKGHGGWDSDMEMTLGEEGKVKKILGSGDVMVKVGGHTWAFNPDCLESAASNGDAESATSSSSDADSDTDDTDWSSSSDSDTGVSLGERLSRALQDAASSALEGLRSRSVFGFEKGDIVTIIKDLSQAKQLQSGHGEWVSSMEAILGQTGKVTSVYFDGDLRVKVCRREWTLNPACCSLAGNAEREAMAAEASDSSSESSEDEEEEDDDDDDDEWESYETSEEDDDDDESEPGELSEEEDDKPERLAALSGGTSSLGGGILGGSAIGDDARLHGVRDGGRLMAAIALDDASTVRDVLSRSKDQANSCVAGKTPLMVAAHQSNVEIVRMLLQAGADVSCTDDDGNSALHYAAAGRKPDAALKLLLESRAPLGAANKRGRTPLHIASANQVDDVALVKLLLERECDPNAQDSDGDTPLLSAIDKGHRAVTAALIEQPTSDLNLKNYQGHNALHRAIVHGDHEAAMAIILKLPAIIDEPTDSGLTALHLAAVHGQKATVEMLLKNKSAVEQVTERQETPLQLAVAHCQAEVAEMLLERGASVFARDERGDTCLHLAIAKHQLLHGGLGDQAKKEYSKVKSALLAAFSADKFRAYEELMARRLQPGESVDVYHSSLTRIAGLVSIAGQDDLVKVSFVTGLPESVRKQIRAACLLDKMTMDEIVEKTRAIMCCHEMSLAAVSSDALKAGSARPSPRKRICFLCKAEGHISRDCALRSSAQRQRRLCFVCGADSHLAAACPDNRADMQAKND